MNTTMAPRVQPAAEGVFEFPTAAGKVRLQSTDDVPPYGGLVPWAAFALHTEIFARLAETCPVQSTSPNTAPVYDVVQRLREDPSVTELFAMNSVVGDNKLRRFFAQLDETTAAEWVTHAAQPLWRALSERVILNWDSTVQTKYGHPKGARRGYNPTKPGGAAPSLDRGGRRHPAGRVIPLSCW